MQNNEESSQHSNTDNNINSMAKLLNYVRNNIIFAVIHPENTCRESCLGVPFATSLDVPHFHLETTWTCRLFPKLLHS